ncbi:MAG: glycosyltransferase family 4 protein [Acidimicrobiia bacterium]|nr:glycosyltransferase family 4 protein [Acidimicrobiia bacterium]
MKIAVASPYGLDHPGGVQDQVILLRDWLNDSGHDAWIVAPGSGDGWRPAGRVVVLPANRSMAPVALTPKAIRQALDAVAGADVVHIHEPLMPAVSLGLALRCRQPLVGTFHADPSRLVRGSYRLGRGPLQRVVSRLQVITAVSEVARSAVAPFADPRVIPNGIDTASFDVDEPRRQHRVVFVGRDEPRKGLAILLEAWPAVMAAFPDAELIVVSDTRRTAPGDVRFVGRVDDAEKRRLLASAAVLCAPNTSGESFGLVVAEGMAAGCAVVASGLPAFVAVLGDAGVYAKPEDPAGLAGVIIGVLGDPARAAALGEAARARVRTFDQSAVGAAYQEAYRDAISAFERTS